MAKMDPEEVRRRLEQEAADEAIAKALDADPDFAKDFDESFDLLFKGFEDDMIGKIAKDNGFSDAQIQKALEEAQRIRKVARGGFLTNGDPTKAAEMLKDSKVLGKVLKAHKKGCLKVVIPIIIGGMAVVGAAIYGTVEAVASVIQ